MNSLDDSTIYVFVRGDLPEEDQFIQGTHATAKVIALRPAVRVSETLQRAWGVPAYADWKVVALDGGSSEKALRRTARKLSEKGVTHIEYSDSDRPEWGLTALATPPLTEQEALPLANYRLRHYSPSAEACAAVDLDVQRGANSNASVAQTGSTEHSAANREVAGAIPAGSSSFRKKQT